MKFGIIQENYLVGDFKGNAAKIKKKILQCEEPVDLFISSEMSLWGYPPQDLLLVDEYIDTSYKVLQNLCLELKEHCFLVGLATRSNSNKIYNSMALCYNGAIQKLFHKCLLPNYDVFDEARYFTPYKECDFFEWRGKKIGICICEDLCYQKEYNLEKNYNTKHLNKLQKNILDFIINPSCSPYSKGKIARRHSFLQTNAKNFNCNILFVNQVGGNDSLIFDGSSFVTTPTEIVFSLASFKTQFVTFNNTCKTSKIKKENQNNELIKALVLGIKDYFKKTFFKKAVLGLSGGIDSALTLFLAVRALGKNNVTAVLMPSPYSSAHSIKDAENLCSNLGVKSYNLPISNLMKAYQNSLHNIFQDNKQDETEENIQTRIRATLLMAIANKEKKLLLTTGNKSEIFVGYCTLYGDMCGALNPIGDLKKTEVYSICKYVNKKSNIFPESILTKAPSAELKPNQTDQDKLPPYNDLDSILEQVVLHNQRLSGLYSKFTKNLALQSYKLFMIAEYKRQQAPLILRISDKAFGMGWRVPIAKKW